MLQPAVSSLVARVQVAQALNNAQRGFVGETPVAESGSGGAAR